MAVGFNVGLFWYQVGSGDCMNNVEFKKIVQEITSKYGFKYCKKLLLRVDRLDCGYWITKIKL